MALTSSELRQDTRAAALASPKAVPPQQDLLGLGQPHVEPELLAGAGSALQRCASRQAECKHPWVAIASAA